MATARTRAQSTKRRYVSRKRRFKIRIGYAKIYWKTIFATILLTLVIVGALQGVVPPLLALWACTNLMAFIVINEKFTRGERWGTRQLVAMLTVLIVTTYLFLALSRIFS